MSIWLQKSASMQKRTSPLKLDHFRLKIPDFIDRIFQQRLAMEAFPAAATNPGVEVLRARVAPVFQDLDLALAELARFAV